MKLNDLNSKDKVVLGICSIAILITFVVRTFHFELPPWGSFCIGIAPNFFAGPIIMIYSKKYLLKNFNLSKNQFQLEIVNYLLAMAALTIYEYLRFKINKNDFDLFDILASIGSGFVYLIYSILSNKKSNDNQME